jgi:hypothetical protein
MEDLKGRADADDTAVIATHAIAKSFQDDIILKLVS